VHRAVALSVTKALVNEIFLRFGIPEKIYSDNGTHFVNNVISLMTKNLGMDLGGHCAYHAQSAGLVERHNGVVGSRLRRIQEIGKN